MKNQIEKFDPSKLMDGVRDRIKATFVSLIPDDAWEKMVEKEIYTFTTGRIVQHHDYIGRDSDCKPTYGDWEERIPYSQTPVKDQWNRPTGKDDISPLQQMIREALEKKFREDLQTFLNGEEYDAVYDQYGAVQVGKAIEEILIKNADIIFKNFIASVMQTAFDKMRSNIVPNTY